MPAPFYCIVSGRRCKKPHDTIDTALAEQIRLHELYEGRKAVAILQTFSTMEPTNFTPAPAGFEPEAPKKKAPKVPVVTFKKRRVVQGGV